MSSEFKHRKVTKSIYMKIEMIKFFHTKTNMYLKNVAKLLHCVSANNLSDQGKASGYQIIFHTFFFKLALGKTRVLTPNQLHNEI